MTQMRDDRYYSTAANDRVSLLIFRPAPERWHLSPIHPGNYQIISRGRTPGQLNPFDPPLGYWFKCNFQQLQLVKQGMVRK